MIVTSLQLSCQLKLMTRLMKILGNSLLFPPHEKTHLVKLKIFGKKLLGSVMHPNLVLKNADSSLRVANFHFWANPLPESIKRALINDFSQVRSDLAMLATCEDCKRLKISIEHFYPDSAGIVTLSGSYIITSSDQAVTTSYFSMTESIQTDGYQAAVQTMRALLTRLARQIAVEL